MNRRTFIALSSLTGAGLILNHTTMGSNFLNSLTEDGNRMPVLFMGHGSPMNAIENNAYTEGWKSLMKDIPTPKAILVISAHWESKGTKVVAVDKPKLIYDMYGFPKELYDVKYPVDGAPELAKEISENVKFTEIGLDHEWGLDHGAWSILVHMYPDASIPCFQLSLNYTRDMQWHYDLAKELSYLRKKGVLIVGSGNIVHNLRYMAYMNSKPFDWALEFDAKTEELMNSGDHASLINYKTLGSAAEISVNSAEHYIPLLYTLALQQKDEKIIYANHDSKDTLIGSFMRSLRIG
ncbi:MAG: 4,5-DOPA dioxygenase extradiol [Bacteroidetes bacterium]|nr:4,5-DOPA dioxygenase extradiol [Bacteroidota bacterium]